MPVAYQVRVFSATGTLQAVLDLQEDVRTINIEHRVNYPSTLTLGLQGMAAPIQFFTLDAIVQVLRRVPEADLDWYTEFVGFHRTPEKQITTADNRIFTSYCRGLLDLIKRRSIRYKADTAGSSKGPDFADDIIKEYVYENAGAAATVANGRVSHGVTVGLVVAADASLAPIYEGANAWKNLLEAIRDIGQPNSVDFDVLWGGAAAPTTFTFETYYPQLGTDRRQGVGTPPMVFSPSLGNMANPTYTQSRTDEISSVAVLGPGEGVLRDVTLRTSLHTADSPWNVIEQDQDASSEDTTDALNAVGDGVLYDKRPAVSFTFDVLQTAQSTYGADYFLGDLVTGAFDDVSADVKIRAVSINVSGGQEQIKLELEEVVTT